MGQALYERIGRGYATYRKADRRIAAMISAGLGAARSVVNIGAGSGSYEPVDRAVVAVEPSAEMIRQRPPTAAAAIRASADRLPFPAGSLDAALAVLTIHHWPARRRGMLEMRRVARDRVVILTWDPEHSGFWLVQEYVPEILEMDRRIFPGMAEIEDALGPIEVRPVPIPGDCTDGFLGAYWRRPASYLDPGARRAISTFAKVRDIAPGLARLQDDIASGAWERKHEDLTSLSELDIGYRLVIARLGNG